MAAKQAGECLHARSVATGPGESLLIRSRGVRGKPCSARASPLIMSPAVVVTAVFAQSHFWSRPALGCPSCLVNVAMDAPAFFLRPPVLGTGALFSVPPTAPFWAQGRLRRAFLSR